ncbi:hypothetical protein N7516_006186 [Penicillium verrucosum]|uniref:uncharacterized protein n=1 Tax=Penicillium verrucosum TaxID=60171 RepID=UPI002545034F|nr:uncharacterized protein N7516_006186 [Penicillium verrucosum]KAJ5931697.1 hypothetical protein N7516_006186 [Penicillium verrucosum]
MHEPISGFYRHGLASEPLTLENFEKFDVATCLSPIRLRVCFGHVPSTESVFPMVNNKARGHCYAFHCWLHSGVRSLNRGVKSYSSAY